MALTERIQIVIDVLNDKATSSVKSFRTSISEADGITGKFRAGASAAFDTVKQHAAAFAAAAGTAVLAFSVKAVSAFQSTALEAGKFADAAGISVEAASRWNEVAGDLGIKAGVVEDSIRKMSKGIADGKPVFDDFADSIVRGKDGTVDADASFRNLVTAIGAIKDPTLQAKAAQDAFGRGYAEMAELMKLSATDLKTALDDVSDAKTIDQAELDKARDARARWDELKDTFEDVKLTVGELVVSMSPLVTKVAHVSQGIIGLTRDVANFIFAAKPASEEASAWWDAIGGHKAMTSSQRFVGFQTAVNDAIAKQSLWEMGSEAVGSYTDAVENLGDGTFGATEHLKDFRTQFDKLAQADPAGAKDIVNTMWALENSTGEVHDRWREWADYMGISRDTIIDLGESLDATTTSTDELADSSSDLTRDLEDEERQLYKAEAASRAARSAADKLTAAYDALMGTIDQEEKWDAFNKAVWEMSDGAGNSAEETRQWKRAAADLVMSLDDMPEEQKTALLLQIDQGDKATVDAVLFKLAQGVNVPVRFNGQGSVGFMKNARGTPPGGSPGGLTLVGEEGPELVDMPKGAVVHTAQETSRMLSSGGSTTIIHNWPQGATARDVAEAERRYRRTQGPL